MLHFIGNTYSNGIAFSDCSLKIKATLSKDNQIQLQKNCFENDSFLRKWYLVLLLSSSVALLLISWLYTRSFLIFLATAIYCIFFNPASISFGIGIINCICYKDYRKFHGAEHKVLNFYKTKERIPTIKELSTYSRFSSTCGSIRTTFKTTYGIIFLYITFTNMLTHPIWSSLTLVGIYILCYILYFFNFFAITQILLTSKPKEKHLRVAIAALTEFLEQKKTEEDKKNKTE